MKREREREREAEEGDKRKEGFRWRGEVTRRRGKVGKGGFRASVTCGREDDVGERE